MTDFKPLSADELQRIVKQARLYIGAPEAVAWADRAVLAARTAQYWQAQAEALAKEIASYLEARSDAKTG